MSTSPPPPLPTLTFARPRWVLGALEASTRAVEEIQKVSYWHKEKEKEKTKKFQEDYGIPEGFTDALMFMQILLGAFCALGEFPPEVTTK